MSKKIDKNNLGPMPWQEFVVGFQVASTALDEAKDGDVSAPDTGGKDSKNLQVQTTAIERDPVLRVMMRIKEHFGVGYVHRANFTYRFWALMHLLRRGHLKPWITSGEDDDFQSFHPAVLLACAEVKLTNTAKFPVKRFLTRVEQIIEEESDD